MTSSPPRTPPRQIIAGDSIEFLIAIPDDYVGWSGAARLTGPNQSFLDASSLNVINDGADLDIFFAGPNQTGKGTSNLCAGQFYLTVWMSTGSGDTAQRITLRQFTLTVFADLSQGAPDAPYPVRALDAIQKALMCRYSGDTPEEFTIDGVSSRKMTVDELERKLNKYSAWVAQLQNPNGSIGRIPFTFSPPTVSPDQRSTPFGARR